MIPERFAGVDFSGARDAGKHLWLARAHRQGEMQGESLVLDQLDRGDRLAQGRREREPVYDALLETLLDLRPAVAGFDFPVGVPSELMAANETWIKYLDRFPMRFPTPEAFRRDCITRAGPPERKRWTDREARTPFAVYGLRMYRQTYHGIASIYRPLVRTGHADALPMMPARPGTLWLLECCPASTLKVLNRYQPYKGRESKHRCARQSLVRFLVDAGGLQCSRRLQRVMLEDTGADALDAVLACWSAWRACERAGFPTEGFPPICRREGLVYW